MFFHKEPIFYGQSESIALDDKGTEFWPLYCGEGQQGEALYDESITKVKTQLLTWMISDVFYTTCTNQSFEHTLTHQIYLLPILFLPQQDVMNQLSYLISGTEVSNSGSRLIDTCAKATASIPPIVFYTMRGRFLLSVTEGIQAKSPTGVPYPTKAQWVALMKVVPWLQYLSYIQDLYETHEEFIKIRDQYYKKLAQDTTIVR